MAPTGFEPVKGKRFTFQTTPGGAWDGVIHCEVLEVVPNERLVFSWKSGHEGNVGYGAPLDTVVTFTLSQVEDGTRLRLVHSGFVLPRNDTAFRNMGEGWKKVVPELGAITGEQDSAKAAAPSRSIGQGAGRRPRSGRSARNSRLTEGSQSCRIKSQASSR